VDDTATLAEARKAATKVDPRKNEVFFIAQKEYVRLVGKRSYD